MSAIGRKRRKEQFILGFEVRLCGTCSRATAAFDLSVDGRHVGGRRRTRVGEPVVSRLVRWPRGRSEASGSAAPCRR